MRRFFWFLVVAAGCVSQGRKIEAAKVDNIVPCKTTEADLLAWFGEPYQRGNQSGFPTMQWAYMHVGVGGNESQSLVVYLNRDKRVVEYQLNPTGGILDLKDKCAGATAEVPKSAEPK
jgi:hypothetical protein